MIIKCPFKCLRIVCEAGLEIYEFKMEQLDPDASGQIILKDRLMLSNAFKLGNDYKIIFGHLGKIVKTPTILESEVICTSVTECLLKKEGHSQRELHKSVLFQIEGSCYTGGITLNMFKPEQLNWVNVGSILTLYIANHFD